MMAYSPDKNGLKNLVGKQSKLEDGIFSGSQIFYFGLNQKIPKFRGSGSEFFILGWIEKFRNPGDRDRDLKIPKYRISISGYENLRKIPKKISSEKSQNPGFLLG